MQCTKQKDVSNLPRGWLVNLNRSYSESDLFHSNKVAGPSRRTFVHKSELYNFPTSTESPKVIKRSVFDDEVVPASSFFPRPELKRYFSSAIVDDQVYLNNSVISFNQQASSLELNNFYTNLADLRITTEHQPMADRRLHVRRNIDKATPMDIDEIDNRELIYNVNNTVTVPLTPTRNFSIARRKTVSDLDKYKPLKNGCPLENGKGKKTNRNLVYYFLFTLLLYTAYVIYFDDIYIYVNSDIQRELLHKELSEKVHDQVGVTNAVLMSLELRTHWQKKTKLLGFIGPSGVGKTYVTNIVKRNFMYKLVHELYGLHITNTFFKEKVLQKIKPCCLNLIVIDDLKKTNLDALFNFVHMLPNDTFILVLAIFNIKEENKGFQDSFSFDDIIEVKKIFDHADVYQDLIVFKPFGDDHARSWLKKQLQQYNVSKDSHGDIIEKTMQGHNIKTHGLKGLGQKMLLQIKTSV